MSNIIRNTLKTLLLGSALLCAGAWAKVNINTATVEELAQLKGIGETKAKAIVEYREANGAFAQVEDLTKVKGIGDKILETLKDDLAVDGKTSFEDVKNRSS